MRSLSVPNLMKYPHFIVIVSLLILPSRLFSSVSDDVDPRIGTDGGGNTIIGPSLPFGMIKPGPDVGNNDENSGWAPNGNINGFSQTTEDHVLQVVRDGLKEPRPVIGIILDLRGNRGGLLRTAVATAEAVT